MSSKSSLPPKLGIGNSILGRIPVPAIAAVFGFLLFGIAGYTWSSDATANKIFIPAAIGCIVCALGAFLYRFVPALIAGMATIIGVCMATTWPKSTGVQNVLVPTIRIALLAAVVSVVVFAIRKQWGRSIKIALFVPLVFIVAFAGNVAWYYQFFGSLPAAKEAAIAPAGNPADYGLAAMDLPAKANYPLAQKYADAAYKDLDLTRPDVMLWLPSTENHVVRGAFSRAVAQVFPAGTTTIASATFPDSWRTRESVATGVESLRILLYKIHAQPGEARRRVLLAGESQGAWVLSEALADPDTRKLVDRAVLLGHPWIANHHFHMDADPGVMELNNPLDPFAMRIQGISTNDATRALEGIMRTPTVRGEIIPFLKIGLHNPGVALNYMLLNAADEGDFPGFWLDTHMYDKQEVTVAKFLRGSDSTTIPSTPLARYNHTTDPPRDPYNRREPDTET